MIKKVSVIAVLIFLTFPSFAQTEKGRLLLGNNFHLFNTTAAFSSYIPSISGFAFGKTKVTATQDDGTTVKSDYKVSAFNLEPTLGYFVANGLALGASLRYSFYQLGGAEEDDKIRSSSAAFVPFARYYFGPKKNIRPYGELRGGIVTSKTKLISAGEDEEIVNDSPIVLGGRFGVSVFFNTKIALDVFGTFEHTRDQHTIDVVVPSDIIKIDQKTESNSFGLGLGLSIFL